VGVPLYRVVVCNGGEGRELHPVSPLAPPKLKYKTSVVFKVTSRLRLRPPPPPPLPHIQDVPRARIADSAWWLGFLLPYLRPAKSNNALKAYESLAFLTGKV
jgi:hypothetical protein